MLEKLNQSGGMSLDEKDLQKSIDSLKEASLPTSPIYSPEEIKLQAAKTLSCSEPIYRQKVLDLWSQGYRMYKTKGKDGTHFMSLNDEGFVDCKITYSDLDYTKLENKDGMVLLFDNRKTRKYLWLD